MRSPFSRNGSRTARPGLKSTLPRLFPAEPKIRQAPQGALGLAAAERDAAPAVHDASWPRCDIDRFVLAKLEKTRLKPVRDADKLTLIRRVTFDLTGLPPTPEEIDTFLGDGSLRPSKGRGPPAGVARVRRALGKALAGRRPLWRIDRLVATCRFPTPGAIATM